MPSGWSRSAGNCRLPRLATGAMSPCGAILNSAARGGRDEVLVPEIERIWQANLQVYGADKIWRQLNSEGVVVARCTVERLMRRQGLQGVMRGKVVRTTISNSKAVCPLDRVNRQFKAERPNQLWLSDFTMSRPSKAGSTFPSLSTFLPGASWAGA